MFECQSFKLCLTGFPEGARAISLVCSADYKICIQNWRSQNFKFSSENSEILTHCHWKMTVFFQSCIDWEAKICVLNFLNNFASFEQTFLTPSVAGWLRFFTISIFEVSNIYHSRSLTRNCFVID